MFHRVDDLSTPSFKFGELSLAGLKLGTDLRNVFVELPFQSLLSLPCALLYPVILIHQSVHFGRHVIDLIILWWGDRSIGAVNRPHPRLPAAFCAELLFQFGHLLSEPSDGVLGLPEEPPQAGALLLVDFELLLGLLELAHLHVALKGLDGLVSLLEDRGEVSDRGLKSEGQQGLLGVLCYLSHGCTSVNKLFEHFLSQG